MDVLLSNPIIVLVGGGFIVGFLIGVTGVGAGSLTTPLLISGVGVHPTVAVGTDLLFAAITKASAAWRHQKLGNVEWGILKWLAMGSLPGAALVLGWLYLAEPDTDVLAGYIRQVLAIALTVSAIAIVLHVIFKDRTPYSADPVNVRKLPTIGYGRPPWCSCCTNICRRRGHRRCRLGRSLSIAAGRGVSSALTLSTRSH